MRWDENYRNPETINDPTVIPAYGVTDTERAYWNRKQDALEYDAEPTPYSDKHLISGAIYNALEQYKIQTTQACQDFYWTIAGGLAETKQACKEYAEAAYQSKTDAAASEGAALLSESAAAASKNAAALSEANAFASKNNAASSATNSLKSSYDSEAWATGTRNGIPVPATDPTYHNNSKYYAGLGSEVIQDDEISQFTTWSSSKLTSDLVDKADLVDGKVPAAQLPSYVDDVKEYASVSAFPAIGESDKIYIALDTNKTYRWSGSSYVEVSESLALGETSSTAYAGDKGKQNADNITAIQSKIPSGAASDNKLVTASDLSTGLSSKSDTGHVHDDRYYTETEIDDKFNGVTFTTINNEICINW